MVTNKKIAEAYGFKTNTIDHWPEEKRNQARLDIEAGVNPIVGDYVGLLQKECYVAQCYLKKFIQLSLSSTCFSVVVKNEEIAFGLLNPYELQGAIVKVQGLYK